MNQNNWEPNNKKSTTLPSDLNLTVCSLLQIFEHDPTTIVEAPTTSTDLTGDDADNNFWEREYWTQLKRVTLVAKEAANVNDDEENETFAQWNKDCCAYESSDFDGTRQVLDQMIHKKRYRIDNCVQRKKQRMMAYVLRDVLTPEKDESGVVDEVGGDVVVVVDQGSNDSGNDGRSTTATTTTTTNDDGGGSPDLFDQSNESGNESERNVQNTRRSIVKNVHSVTRVAAVNSTSTVVAASVAQDTRLVSEPLRANPSPNKTTKSNIETIEVVEEVLNDSSDDKLTPAVTPVQQNDKRSFTSTTTTKRSFQPISASSLNKRPESGLFKPRFVPVKPPSLQPNSNLNRIDKNNSPNQGVDRSVSGAASSGHLGTGTSVRKTFKPVVPPSLAKRMGPATTRSPQQSDQRIQRSTTPKSHTNNDDVIDLTDDPPNTITTVAPSTRSICPLCSSAFPSYEQMKKHLATCTAIDDDF